MKAYEYRAGLLVRRIVRRRLKAWANALPEFRWSEDKGLLDSVFYVRVPEHADKSFRSGMGRIMEALA